MRKDHMLKDTQPYDEDEEVKNDERPRKRLKSKKVYQEEVQEGNFIFQLKYFYNYSHLYIDY